jgi:hypothetical protein
MPELNALGQMDPVVRHAHEERMENYKIHMRSYTEAARKLDRDCGIATAILLSLLSPSILGRVTSKRNRVINNSLEAEFIRLIEFVAATYGPQSMVDVGMLRQSITDLTDKDGYVVLMPKVEELQNQLRQVKVKDAEGNILLDAEGNERNHAMTDAELYGTYLQKLGANGNPTFYRLKELFSGDPTGNYGALMAMMMNNYCKDPETWDTHRGVRSTTRVAKTKAASTSQQGNNSNQRKRKADKATIMRCFNCKKEGHLVSDCLDPRCYTCAIQFATLADRKEHEKKVVHKRQKKKRDNNNNNIAINLATMKTCGDCNDDEDA